jgi:hypothetical protein
MSYQYTTLLIPEGKNLVEEMNALGSEGWQIFQVIDMRGKGDGVNWLLFAVKMV